MKSARGLTGWLVALAVFAGIMASGGGAFAYSLSGTVTNATSKSGRVYISLGSSYGGSNGQGVSIVAPASGQSAPFTIRGVPAGYYVVRAFMDTRNTGTQHANDPTGASAMVSVAGDTAGAAIQLVNPTPVAVQPPSQASALPMASGALVNWDPPTFDNQSSNSSLEIADSYNIYRQSVAPSTTTCPTGPAGYSLVRGGIPASDDDIWLQRGLTDGTTWCYQVTAVLGGNESAPSPPSEPVTIGAIPGGQSVSGTVAFPGITATGPLYVAIYSDSAGIFLTRVDNPVSPQQFTVPGVQDGAYQVYAVLDQNDSGITDDGDVTINERLATAVTVNGAAVGNVAVTLETANAATRVGTSHRQSQSGERYDLSFGVSAGVKRPVKVALVSGPEIVEPVDLALRDRGSFEYWLGDVTRPVPQTQQYGFDIVYADGSVEQGVTAPVSGVLDSFPVPLAPTGRTTYTPQPTFTWAPPQALPAGPYSYQLRLEGDMSSWDTDRIPAGTTSMQYNADGRAYQPSLADNATYTWQITVEDAQGNQSQSEAVFFFGGSISGKVTNAGTGAGIGGLSVRLYDGNGNNMPWNYQATTAADGSYVIGGLTSGAYRVCFDTYQTDYIGRCYNIQEYNSYNAANVPVTSPSDTSNISVALTAGGSVSGTVTAAGGGIAGAWVELRDPQGYGVPGTSTAYTDASGAYTIHGVPAGTYTVWFNGGGTGYVGAWYKAPGETQSATQINVVTGQAVTGISGVLTTGGSITGTVTSGGNGVAGVQVELRDPQGNWLPDGKNTQTGNDGTYALQGVSPGSYTVYFNGSWAGYIGQWYDGQASAGSATPVAVTAGQTVSGIDAILLQGGSISGRVTDLNGGAGVAGVYVQLYDGQGMGIPGIWGISTAADGTYSVKGLVSGTYKVCFTPGSTSYIGGCYNQQVLAPWSATPVPVTAPNDTPNINAQLTTGGTITGRVTSDGTNGIPDIRVELRDQNGNWVQGVNNVNTSPDGSYALGGIPTGSYKLFFGGNQTGFIGEWHNNQPTAEQATPIGIVAGQTVPGVNAILAAGGTISGKVADASTGLGISGVQVELTDSNGNGLPDVWGITTASDGTYEIKGLASGSYRVCFSAGSTNYIGRCYNDKTFYSGDADPVGVTAPNTTAGINASLSLGGSVSGRVTAGGQGLANVWVELKDTNGNYIFGISSAMTDGSGNYTLGGIPAGTYTLYFSPGPGGYVGQWYNGKLSVESANRITLAAGQKLADINVALALGGSITGTVGGPQGPIPGLNVKLYDAAGLPIPFFNAYTMYDGTYTITGVPAGSYKLFVDTGASGLVSQWYNGKLSPGSADPVDLAPGQDLAGINLTLAQGGYLSGHVKNSGNSPVAGVTVQVFDSNGTLLPGSGITDSFGNYYLSGVPAGDVKVFFNADQAGYYSQWNNFKANLQAADPVPVTAGNSFNLADALLMSKQTSTTSLTISPNPAVYGQTVTATARVTPPTAVGGKVQFRINNINWGEAVDVTLVNGTATAVKTDASLPAIVGNEPYAVTADYLGAADLAPSGTLPVSLTVNRAASSIAVVSSNDSTVYGQSATVTATVTILAPGSGTSTGTVTFKDGQNIIGTGTLNGSGQVTLTLSSLSAGVHALTAVYGGDANVTGSTSGGIVQTVGKAGTAASLNSSVNPSNNGQSVTFTATLTVAAPGGGTPTGVVTFMDGATPIGTGALDAAAQATVTTASLAVGDHGITAVYNGDANFTGSTSTQIIQTVVQPQAKLDVTVAGGGSGSVHSAPAGIACTGGNCTASFDLNSQITLTATTDSVTVFTGWSGACNGTDDECVVTMSGDKGVTATFAAAARVKIGSTSYPTLQNAYDQAAGGVTIKALGGDFAENLTLGAAKNVTLIGGYDPSYLSLTGWSSIHGVLKVGQGQLIVERVKVW